jgi:hypothetical protein
MKKELDDKLVQTFPLTYADRHKDKTETCMCWGFSTFEGWFQIIWDLSAKLEEMIKDWLQKNPGKEHPRVAQVKEKFATLRVYLHAYDATGNDPTVQAMYDEIQKAVDKSAKTCEWCGQPGKFRDMPWKKTFCQEHFEQWQAGKRPFKTYQEEFPKEMNDFQNLLRQMPQEEIELSKSILQKMLKKRQQNKE